VDIVNGIIGKLKTIQFHETSLRGISDRHGMVNPTVALSREYSEIMNKAFGVIENRLDDLEQ
jgi:hypothetical protein